MSDLDPEMIERANRARMENLRGKPLADHEYRALRSQVEVDALTAALEAAAPLISAKALRNAAYYGPMHFAATHRDQWSRGRLLVTQAWLRDRADRIEQGGQP